MKKSEETDYGEYSKGAESENECARKAIVDEIVGEVLRFHADEEKKKAETKPKEGRCDP